MKIDSSIKTIGGSNAPAETRADKADARNAHTGETGGVRLHLSALSSQLQATGGGIAADEVVNAGRVAEIKTAIAEGRIRVNPEAIADHLLETVRELMVSNKP